MNEEKKLFIPVFYSALEITSTLSDEEFGKIVRALLASRGRKDYVPRLASHLAIAYNFMLDSAIRVFGNSYGASQKSRTRSSSKRELTPEEEEYAEEAFRRALERSYGSAQIQNLPDL